MSSLVSVIIPIYNMEQFIERCIQSVLSQRYNDLEIILINDGSNDNSASICDKFAKNYPNIIFINQENKGVSSARNIGMQIATGKYLTFLDADDFLPPNAIYALVEAAEKVDSDMAIGKIAETEQIPIGVFEGMDFLIKVLEDNPIAYYSYRILYKRTFVQDVDFPEGFGCGEDSYFVFECALKQPKVITIREQVYVYCANQNSATRSSFTVKRYNDVCNLLNKKEIIISEQFPELIPLFYHLKVKIQMMLLANLSLAKGESFRQKEKDTLVRFNEIKNYFRSDLPYSNECYYRVLSNNMYYMYKIFRNIKRNIKRILRR